MTVDSQMGEKRPDFLGSHLVGMTSVVKDNKASDPTDVGFFSAETQVSQTDGITHLIEQLGFWHHQVSHARMADAMALTSRAGAMCMVCCHALHVEQRHASSGSFDTIRATLSASCAARVIVS